MKRTLFLLFLPLLLSAGAPSFQLLTAFRSATPGDYWVAAEGKNQTLLLVANREGERLTFEEITRPDRGKKNTPANWAEWVQSGAPQHTSWVSYQIDLSHGRVVSAYSRTRNQWLDSSSSNQLLSTLFTLSFQPMRSDYRRRVGAVTAADPLSRPLWQPPLTFQGERQPNTPFSAWVARWPQDGSELAGKEVTIYLPDREGPYPSYFPYWIETNDTYSTAKLRIIDSGRELSTSPLTISTPPFSPPILLTSDSPK